MTESVGLDARDIFAYTLRLRERILGALRTVPHELLDREMNTNHHTILRTLIHIMAVEESWVREDLLGEPPLSWVQFQARYLGGQETIAAIVSGWEDITGRTVTYLRDHPDLGMTVNLGPGYSTTSFSVEQIVYHLAGEEMIHMGEVLAMTRQLGVDLPGYFLLNVMSAGDRPWRQLELAHTPRSHDNGESSR